MVTQLINFIKTLIDAVANYHDYDKYEESDDKQM